MNVEFYGNLTGFQGTERTIRHMKRLVQEGKRDPVVVLKAQQIVKNIHRDNWYRIGAALHNWVQKKIRYVRDPNGVELVKSPRITMAQGTGDCDDQAILWSALAESVGMRTRFKTVRANPAYPNDFSHVYSQGYVPGRGWLAADTIVTHARFGDDVAKKYPSMHWEGNSSMNGASITAGELSGVGEVIFANDQTFENPDNGAFGSYPYRGNQYDTLPMMVGREGSTSALTDDVDDFWSGQSGSDIDSGPPLKSALLPPGVGAMNGIGQVGAHAPYDQWEGEIADRAYVPVDGTMGELGRWRPFKRIADRIKKRGRILGIKISTQVTRSKARTKAMNQVFDPLWSSEAMDRFKALVYRVESSLVDLQSGKQPRFIVRPPSSGVDSPSMSGGVLGSLFGFLGLGNGDFIRQAWEETTAGQVTSILSQIGEGRDQEAAKKKVDSRRAEFEGTVMPALIDAFQKLETEFVASGGTSVPEGAKPPEEWVTAYEEQIRKKLNNSHGDDGWSWHYIKHLIDRMKTATSGVKNAKGILQKAFNVRKEVNGSKTVKAAASVVKAAADAGSIDASEVKDAMNITTRAAMGYPLTAEEQALAKKVGRGAGGVPKAVWYAIPAAAAVIIGASI